SVKDSGTSYWYQQSDVARLRFLCDEVERYRQAGKQSAMMYTALISEMSNLMFSEADRRKANIELQHPATTEEEDAQVAHIDRYRNGLSGAARRAEKMARDVKIDNWNHKVLGNTWKGNDEGTSYLAEKTRGWGVLGWCSSYLLNDKGEPWVFTPEQARFVLWWYAVDDRGRFLYRSGVLQRLKGWGKDPITAALCLAELVGPVKFHSFDRHGEPVAVPQPVPYVTISAVSAEQTRNTSD